MPHATCCWSWAPPGPALRGTTAGCCALGPGCRATSHGSAFFIGVGLAAHLEAAGRLLLSRPLRLPGLFPPCQVLLHLAALVALPCLAGLPCCLSPAGRQRLALWGSLHPRQGLAAWKSGSASGCTSHSMHSRSCLAPTAAWKQCSWAAQPKLAARGCRLTGARLCMPVKVVQGCSGLGI